MRPDPFAWQLHVEAVVGLALLTGLYVAAVRRHSASPWRITAFAAGVLLLLLTAVTPLDSLTFHLLSAHLLQNVILAEWAPALLVAGVPAALAAGFDDLPGWRTLTRPVVALPVWIATYSLWHLPPAYDAALRHPETLLHLEHATYLAAGALLWWPVLQSPLSSGLRAGYIFLAFVLASPIGLLLVLLPEPAYGFYDGGFAPWDLTALADQRIAGVAMVAEQAIGFFALFAWSFFRFLAEEDAREAMV